MYGLPADTARHKYTKKVPAPHPFWNEAPFTFKRVCIYSTIYAYTYGILYIHCMYMYIVELKSGHHWVRLKCPE